ncbi:hypothetical protein [Solwaraspora sp. WMMA2101]|uniref:hypothetical protein n=1 Tax=Solwaraspora sp. WMMA2101 TaxID=3404124 RepID=UPI003B937C56
MVAVLLGLAGLFVAALGDMISEEVRTRLDQLPHALVRLAARRMPASMRDELLEEWQGELYEFLHGAEAMPVTRLVRGLRYATGLLWTTPKVARALNTQVAKRTNHRNIDLLILFGAGAGSGMMATLALGAGVGLTGSMGIAFLVIGTVTIAVAIRRRQIAKKDGR